VVNYLEAVMANPNLSSGSIRLETSSARPRTSSNLNGTEPFRIGIGNASNLASSVVRNTMPRVPGTAALSASLSEAAGNLHGHSGLSASATLGGQSAGVGAGIDGDLGSLQEQMFRNNEQLFAQQLSVSLETNRVTAQSAVAKAWSDAQKSIVANIK
jgi:hypothetical protein